MGGMLMRLCWKNRLHTESLSCYDGRSCKSRMINGRESVASVARMRAATCGTTNLRTRIRFAHPGYLLLAGIDPNLPPPLYVGAMLIAHRNKQLLRKNIFVPEKRFKPL